MRRTLLFTSILIALQARGELTIPRMSGSIVIDGDTSDSGWQSATRVERFVEFMKSDNTQPPALTIAKIAYDSTFVYVAFEAKDPHPDQIRAPFIDRDKVGEDQDYVEVMIDTRDDKRSAMGFRVNARGIQADSNFDDTLNAEDFSPDYFFDSAARVTPDGWSAEIRIPLSTLRYPARDPQTWGVMFIRNYPRHFRYVMANVQIPKSSNCFICHEDDFGGIEGLPMGGHMTVAPYTSAQRVESTRTLGARLTPEPMRGDTGGDLKWNPSTTLTFDATLNPDFSQIESDVPNITANSRFAFDYPEKRPFFLEGVDLLNTPIRAVYTRSIESPAWGMRATGQSGNLAYTALLASDRAGGTTILPAALGSSSIIRDDRTLAGLGRVRETIGQSFIGFLSTIREGNGEHNRVFGPDFMWKLNESDRVIGEALISDTSGSSVGHGLRVYATRDRKNYDVYLGVRDFSDSFRADNGFVPQVGIRSFYGEMGYHLYPKSGVSYIRPYLGVERIVRVSDRGLVHDGLYPGVYFEGGPLASRGWITLHPADRDAVQTSDFRSSFIEFDLRGVPSRWLTSIVLHGTAGEKLDYGGVRKGHGASLQGTGEVRPTDHLDFALTANREWLRVGNGERVFTAQIERIKATYTISPRSLVRAIAQYDAVDQSIRSGGFTTSLLYGYRLNWQTVFYAGYGDERLLDDTARMRRNGSSIFAKVSYAWQR
jgi:hypothetical protein